MSATHRVNVNARNVDHWSWSLDGGPDNMMPPGSTYADITIEGGGGSKVSCGIPMGIQKFAGLYVRGTGSNASQKYYSGWSSGDTYNIGADSNTVGYAVKYTAIHEEGVTGSNYQHYDYTMASGTTIWRKGSGLNAATVLSKLNSDFNKFSTQSGVGKSGVLPHIGGGDADRTYNNSSYGWFMDLSWSGVAVDSNGGLTGACCAGLDWNGHPSGSNPYNPAYAQDAISSTATQKGLRRFSLLLGSSGGVYNAVLRPTPQTPSGFGRGYHLSGFLYGSDERDELVGFHDWNATINSSAVASGTGTLYSVEDFLTEFRTVNNLPSTEDFAIIECYGAIPFTWTGND